MELLTRLPDWEDRLAAYLAAKAGEPFAWGVNDCALFACGAIEAMTGDHPGARFAGTYDDAKGAAKVLRLVGEGTLAKTFSSSFPEVSPGMAQRGDVVEAQGAVGICMGAFGLFLADADHGIIRLPRATFTKAWRV